MEIKKYAMRTFGIDVKSIGLNDDEQELLEEIRMAHEWTRMMEQPEKEPEFEIDEEFSKLCCQAWI